MDIDTGSGLLQQARQVMSPNCDDRPAGTSVDLIVIHGISLPPGEFGGPWIDALFTNTLDPAVHPYFEKIQGFKVSTHLLIRRDGQMVQYVPFHRRAWHAGRSVFAGRPECNDYSIGIELEGADHIPYRAVQYRRLVRVIVALKRVYPTLLNGSIAGHADIAPDRKTDPGPAFRWELLWRLLQGLPN